MPKPVASSGAKLLRNILKHDEGIDAWLEYHFPPYYIDVYLPDHHIGIEYDGPRHLFKSDDDAMRAAEITKRGLPLMRIDYLELKEIRHDAESRSKFMKKLRKFIRMYGRSLRKKQNSAQDGAQGGQSLGRDVGDTE